MVLSKTWWKKIFTLFLVFTVPALIGIGIYTLITMNNTISALSNKVNEQQDVIAAYQTVTPLPDNHGAEISEVEILYSQKEAMVNDYSAQGEALKQTYSKNKDFNKTYIIECEENTDTEYFIRQSGILADKYDFDPIMLQSAGRAALYYKFAKEARQVLIEARGLIDLLKTNYSDAEYARIKNLLISIIEPEY